MTIAIHIKDLHKKYPTNIALKGINLEIKEGEFFGLLGPNGAGKTTTINILTGLANKTSGEAKLFNKDVVKDYREARSLIGLVPQEFNIDQFETVYNILFFNAGYFGIPESERPSRIKSLLKRLNLWEKKNSKFRTLSGGMKRKVMIARALLHKPRILILDEPTAGVDVETRRHMWEYFRELNEKGTTILLTTHYIEEAEEMCDRIAIINHGKIIKLDDKKNIMKVLGGERAILSLETPIKIIPKELKKHKAEILNGGNIISIPFKGGIKQWQMVLKDIEKTNLKVDSIETQRKRLEDIFVELIHK